MKYEFQKSAPLFVLLLCFSFFANSQKNFKDGFVVLKSGDTLRGKIDYRNWEVNPVRIDFNQSGSITRYSTKDLHCFEVTGADFYETKIVSKDMRPVDVQGLSDGVNNADSAIIDTVFLRRLVAGKNLTLYELVDTKHHYYIQKGGQSNADELVYKKYLDDRQDLHVQPLYKNQLSAFVGGVNDPEMLIKRINNCKYNEDDLTDVVFMINGDGTNARKKNENRKGDPFVIMAGVGVSYMNFKFVGQIDQWTQLDFSGSIGKSVGIAFDFSGNRNLQQLALRMGFYYNHIVYNGKKETNDYFGKPTLNTYKIVQNNFTPEIGVLYNFVRNKNFKAYIGTTLAFNIASYSKNEFKSTTLSTGEEHVSQNPLDFESFWLAYNVMAGVKLWNKCNINLGTIISGRFVSYTGLRSEMHPISLSVAYFIFSKN